MIIRKKARRCVGIPTVIAPIVLTPQYLILGKDVFILNGARIEGFGNYNGQRFLPEIEIGNSVCIQQNLHLTCAHQIVIGDRTSIAASVTISDIIHPYENIQLSIDDQPLETQPVIIGCDCKIYNNAVILPGTKIGNHVVIGANSIVSGTIPDYCVVVGAPCRIVKRYDFNRNDWFKTDKSGDFIE